MLVLRRKIGEILMISGGVEIEVMGISRSRVKLGIRAPREVVVQRKESLPIAEENMQAARLLADGGILHGGVMERLFPQYYRNPSATADM